jgi:hypothetical protein
VIPLVAHVCHDGESTDGTELVAETKTLSLSLQAAMLKFTVRLFVATVEPFEISLRINTGGVGGTVSTVIEFVVGDALTFPPISRAKR